MVKSNFLISQVSGSDPFSYHFICLLSCDDLVLSTDCLSSADILPEAALCFYNCVRFEQLNSDFKIRLEIYGMAVAKACKKRSKKLLDFRSPAKTPTKAKLAHSAKKLSSRSGEANPAYNSSASGFKLLGHCTIDRKNYSSSRFILQDFIIDSPLEEGFTACIRLS